MKLIDIANKIDKSENNEEFVNVDELGYIFDLNVSWTEQNRLKSYWVGNWYCTDTWVGYKMYFLDDEPVAFSIQQGRKCDENIKWFSQSLAIKVKKYLMELADNNKTEVDTCDINDDIGDSYKIEFNNQILNPENATYHGESIKILEHIKDDPDYGIDKNLKIQLPNNKTKIVNIHDLDFKFNLAE